MSGTSTIAWWRRRRSVAICSVIGGVIAAWLAYDFWTRRSTEQSYRDAMAEADRLDPKWRKGILAEAPPEIPDDENSALLVLSSYEKIPGGWQALKGQWPPLPLKPRQSLAPELLIALKKSREEAKDGLADARALVNRPRGKFPHWRVEVPRAVPLSRRQVETVSQLLYVDALVRMPQFAQEVTRYSKGVWSSRLRLYPEGFFEAWLPVPPLEEQRSIVAHIAEETAKLDALRAAGEGTLALLKERRAALIAAAVTGRLQIQKQ